MLVGHDMVIRVFRLLRRGFFCPALFIFFGQLAYFFGLFLGVQLGLAQGFLLTLLLQFFCFALRHIVRLFLLFAMGLACPPLCGVLSLQLSLAGFFFRITLGLFLRLTLGLVFGFAFGLLFGLTPGLCFCFQTRLLFCFLLTLLLFQRVTSYVGARLAHLNLYGFALAADYRHAQGADGLALQRHPLGFFIISAMLFL